MIADYDPYLTEMYNTGDLNCDFSSELLIDSMKAGEQVDNCVKELDLRKDLKPKGIEGFVPKQLLEFSELFYLLEQHEQKSSSGQLPQYITESYKARLETSNNSMERSKEYFYQ